MRILEGRRSRLEERLDRVRGSLTRTREKLDGYTLELQRHGLESVEREVRWLNELITAERHAGANPEAAGAEVPVDPAKDDRELRTPTQDVASDPSASNN
jgi:hypothetical protein